MLIETCTSFNDKYVQVDYPPVAKWEDDLKSYWYEYFQKRHPKVILAWHIAIHFVDKRKDIPGPGDKRKMLGTLTYRKDMKNSCDIYIWTKSSRINKFHILYQSEKYIAKLFTDDSLHYNNDGDECHCERGSERRLSHE